MGDQDVPVATGTFAVRTVQDPLTGKPITALVLPAAGAGIALMIAGEAAPRVYLVAGSPGSGLWVGDGTTAPTQLFGTTAPDVNPLQPATVAGAGTEQDVAGGNSTGSDGGDVQMQAGTTSFAAGSPGGAFVKGGPGTVGDQAGGQATVRGGAGFGAGNGARARVVGGTAPGAGTGGDAQLQAGVSSAGTNGAAKVLDSAGNTIIQVGPTASRLGLYGATPVARAAAYTQTYATASRTVAAATAAAVATTAAALASYGYAQAQADAIPVAINALAADVLVLRQLVNSLINDSGALGIHS